MNCEKCNSRTYTKRVGPHIGLYCEWCGWIKWIPQPWQNFTMPIGKYSGKTLLEIIKIDIEYLIWCEKNLEEESIKKRITEALDEKEKINA